MINKNAVIYALFHQLEQSLTVAIDSATHAHEDATHDQSKAETQYDSLGIEMAYLAEGQSRRITELKQEVISLKALTLPSQFDTIQLGHLVTLSDGTEQGDLVVFISPVAGGNQIMIDNVKIQVVTTTAPLAKKVLNQSLYDCVQLEWLDTEYEITNIE